MSGMCSVGHTFGAKNAGFENANSRSSSSVLTTSMDSSWRRREIDDDDDVSCTSSSTEFSSRVIPSPFLSLLLCNMVSSKSSVRGLA
jgi:hypothetical protein